MGTTRFALVLALALAPAPAYAQVNTFKGASPEAQRANQSQRQRSDHRRAPVHPGVGNEHVQHCEDRADHQIGRQQEARARQLLQERQPLDQTYRSTVHGNVREPDEADFGGIDLKLRGPAANQLDGTLRVQRARIVPICRREAEYWQACCRSFLCSPA